MNAFSALLGSNQQLTRNSVQAKKTPRTVTAGHLFFINSLQSVRHARIKGPSPCSPSTSKSRNPWGSRQSLLFACLPDPAWSRRSFRLNFSKKRFTTLFCPPPNRLNLCLLVSAPHFCTLLVLFILIRHNAIDAFRAACSIWLFIKSRPYHVSLSLFIHDKESH